jgi:tRNA pseudouridine32 synthase / 23S rRNA pseudouridine746 synthase
MFHALPTEIIPLIDSQADPVSYWYEGKDPLVGNPLRLPRTAAAEALGRHLMAQLAADWGDSSAVTGLEGKMYGVLLVERPNGERGWLKAFSGLLGGLARLPGWVPPIPGRDRVALLEAQTLHQLEALKLEIRALKGLPQRRDYERLSQDFAMRLRAMGDRHRQNKAQRQAQRQALQATGETAAQPQAILETLDAQSRRDGRERRMLKRERDQALEPLGQTIAQADGAICSLKQRRKALSQQLQAELYRAYRLKNFAGAEVSLRDLGRQQPEGLPTGTGECCAPKLLHYAASQGLKPLALAEFWWGPFAEEQAEERQPGQFYGACQARCQPLMGFLLSGLEQHILAQPCQPASTDLSLPILYEDDWLIAVDKPPGLLSVPGRSRHRQDSVLSRLRHQLRDGDGELLGNRLQPVHRLDQDTSGILLLAKDPASHRYLQGQFEQRQVHKTYEALLQGSLMVKGGQISLPLSPDPHRPPRQRLDPKGGKPSLTRFVVLDRRQGLSRVRFEPVTGRSHQLRVHAAMGLGMPIVGDRLYGSGEGRNEGGDREAKVLHHRLHLHAQRLSFSHCVTHKLIQLQSQVPF